ncbi:Polyamine aminopropyltransferase [Planctomycetales bacterium 10988]|nr:Polyamine aminopropyltransferase [Planctomycetales bacterium 10988]
MSDSQLSPKYWIREELSPCDEYGHGITKEFISKQTPFQKMSIVETGVYGKALVLDDLWQSCTGDEFLYHEPLVHPACIHQQEPKKVLILGGGEGATLREVFKWHSVEKAVMVDIDREVVDACKEFLPEMHQGAFDDPRAEVKITDALHYLDEEESAWDIIISDLSDPIEEGPSFALFTKEYYELCQKALKPEGTLVVQAGPVAPVGLKLHVRLVNTLKAVFPHVVSYSSFVPTYAQPWSFAMASAKPIDRRPEPEAIDAMLKESTTGEFRMLDGMALLGLMNGPKHIREAIEQETEIYTKAAPPKYMNQGVAGG